MRPEGLPSPWTRLLLYGSLLASALTLVSLGLRTAKHPFTNGGDTMALVRGVPTITRCLSSGVFLRCNAWAHPRHLPVISQFPLIQTVPAVLLHLAGLSVNENYGALAWLNFVTVIVVVGVTLRWCYIRYGSAHAVVVGMLLVPGMLVAYMAQGFGEALAAAVFIGLVLAGLRADRVSPWLLPMAFLATVTKETAAPLVLLFGLAAIVLSGTKGRVLMWAGLNLAIGILVGLLLSGAFNQFRYGTLINHVYLSFPYSPLTLVPNNAAALIVSPNAGITWFWPGVTAAGSVLVVALARGGWGRDLGPADRRKRLGVFLGLGAFAAYVVSLGLWWDPEGWYAWGPRLIIPAAAGLVALATPLIGVNQLRRVWLSWPGLIASALIGIAVLLPTIGTVFGIGNENINITATWRDMPRCVSDRPKFATKLYDQCERREQWRLTSMPLTEAVPKVAPPGQLRYWSTIAAAAAAIGLGLAFARTRRPGLDPDPDPGLDGRPLGYPKDQQEVLRADRAGSAGTGPPPTMAE